MDISDHLDKKKHKGIAGLVFRVSFIVFLMALIPIRIYFALVKQDVPDWLAIAFICALLLAIIYMFFYLLIKKFKGQLDKDQ